MISYRRVLLRLNRDESSRQRVFSYRTRGSIQVHTAHFIYRKLKRWECKGEKVGLYCKDGKHGILSENPPLCQNTNTINFESLFVFLQCFYLTLNPNRIRLSCRGSLLQQKNATPLGHPFLKNGLSRRIFSPLRNKRM